MLTLDPATTALVVVDLQKGVVGMQTLPHTSADVVTRTVRLARAFRSVKAPVVLVNVSFSADFADTLKQPNDAPVQGGSRPAGWDQLVAELEVSPTDILITKRQWGAFYGTGLDLQLRRRGVRTIVLAGIATNFGVESTARDAWERNYAVVFAEDAVSAIGEENHRFAFGTIFPRLGLVRSSAEIADAIGG